MVAREHAGSRVIVAVVASCGFWVAAFYGYGCSSSSDATSAGDGDASHDDDDIATDAGREAATPDGDAGSFAGSVVFSESLTDAGYSGYVSAQFYAAGGELSQGCATTTMGACSFVDCSDAGAPTPLSGVKVGTLTVSGGKLAAPVTLSFQTTAGGSYGSPSQSSQLFAAGDTFDVAATGDAVEAFTATTGKAPGDLLLTAPVPGGDGNYALDETQDLTVSWGGGTYVDEEIAVTISNGPSIYLSCAFDASKGTATVPASLLAMLGAVSLDEGEFSVQGTSSTFVATDNATIQLLILAPPFVQAVIDTPK